MHVKLIKIEHKLYVLNLYIGLMYLFEEKKSAYKQCRNFTPKEINTFTVGKYV